MVSITKEIYYEEISKAVFKDLKNKLLYKQRNHCMRVDFLPIPVMEHVCEKINNDAKLQAKQVEAYLLTDQAQKKYEIESGRLIELRNRLDFGVLLVFIPQGFTGAAEDSYDIHTFESYDLAGVFNRHKKELIASFSEKEQAIINLVFESSAVSKQSIENQIRYILALKNDECTYETVGGYLYYVNLIPDLKLNEEDVQARLLRNRECVDQLSNPDQTLFLAIEALVNKGLDSNHNNLKSNLLNFFLNRNPNQVSEWTRTILEDQDWLKKISFDKWRFKDLSGEKVEIYLEPFRDKEGNPLAYTKLIIEGDNLVATTNTKMRIRWRTSPRKAAVVSKFILILERDEESETSTEFHRKTAKGSSEQAVFPFKDVELEEGEEWLAHIRIIALDQNKAKIAEDTSEPFYLRGEKSDIIGEETKRYNKIRNIAEATLKTSYKYRREVEIISKSWEPGSKLLYRIKTSPRETYQIVLNDILYDLELKTLQDPYCCGIWDLDIFNRGFIEESDFKPVKIKLNVFRDEYNQFLAARCELFHAITSFGDAAVIEILDLREFKELILNYVTKYLNLTQKIKESIQSATDAEVNNFLENNYILNRLDTIHVIMGTEEESEEIVLMMPTHPIKILWLLQYQTLLFNWSAQMVGMEEKDLRNAFDIDGVEKILPLNIPNALAFEKSQFFINTDVLDLHWSIFPKSTTNDIRKVVAMLSRALGYKDDLGNISSVTPKQIADRAWRYLRHHPYIKTLKINVINPGDGLLFLNTIRELQKIDEYKHLRYDITFYGTLGYELMGNAFDNLINESDSSENRLEADEELLQPSHNPLFPKLFFSKVKVDPDKWEQVDFKEANITVIIDHFLTTTVSRPKGDLPGSYFLHGLLAEYLSEFNIMESAVTWSRKVIPSKTKEIEDGEIISNLLYQVGENFLGLSCAFFDWGKSTGYLPTIQLELNKQDKHILSQIHELSDWVFTIDRNFGIEYFDNPSGANPYLKSYLIDYTPEFMDGVGHRLIVSTGWINEIEKLIEDGLQKIHIPTSSFRAIKILDIIKSISGKLALKLINNPNNVREIIGLAITRLALEKDGILENSILIPVDTHVDIFAENKRRSIEDEVTVKRSDLILVSSKQGKLNLNLIEVKFRSREGNISESLALKEEIFLKNENSEKAFKTKFISTKENPKIDIQLANKSLSTLISFYLERSKRNGFCNNCLELIDVIQNINKGEVEVAFEKTGYIIHWAGITKPVDNYKGNQIYELGHEDIIDLLDIRETEIEEEDSSVVDSESPIVTKQEQKEEYELIPPKIHEKETEENFEESTETKNTKAEENKQITSELMKPNILLGKNVDNGKDVWFNPVKVEPKKLANQHLLIVGKSGAGKSQTTSSILCELDHQSIPFLILDFQGEYISPVLKNSKNQTFVDVTKSVEFDPSLGMDINPLELSFDRNKGQKTSFMNNVYQVSGILKQIFGLGDIQHPILKDAIKRSYYERGFLVEDRSTWNNEPPAFQDIWYVLEFLEQIEGLNVKNLKYRIEPLFENNIFISGDSSFSIDEMLNQNSIVNLSTLPTPEIMKSVARFILQSIYNRMLAQGPSREIRLYVVIDEAHKLSYDQTLTDLIREARKYGVGFILASQSVRDFATIVFENMGTKIALQLEGEDAKYMAENFGVTDRFIKKSVLEMLPNQKPLRALLRNNHYEPFVQVDINPFYRK